MRFVRSDERVQLSESFSWGSMSGTLFVEGTREPSEGRQMSMTIAQAPISKALYEQDETAWLDTMSELIRLGRFDEVDYPNLAEYLADMARRDRREVESRLTTLITHLLKWSHQPDRRSGSWRATIVEQRQELEGLVGQGVLRNHAEAMIEDAYHKAIERAVAETGLPAETFPAVCSYTLNWLLTTDLIAE